MKKIALALAVCMISCAPAFATCKSDATDKKLAVPAEFENVHAWDYSKFGRGERFYYRTLPREEFDDTLAQVKRWGLDQYLKDRSYETLSYSR